MTSAVDWLAPQQPSAKLRALRAEVDRLSTEACRFYGCPCYPDAFVKWYRQQKAEAAAEATAAVRQLDLGAA